MRDFIADFIEEWGPLLLWGSIIAVVLTLAVVAVIRHDQARQRQCDLAYSMATTARDSLTVMGMCELREEHTTTVITAPVYVR